MLINTSNEERTVRLVLGPTPGDVKLAQNATLAVEVERKYVPGNDPRKRRRRWWRGCMCRTVA